MKVGIKSIMLVDDNVDDNFIHERAIKKKASDIEVVVKNSGLDALDYLKSTEAPKSDLIFLDINMPNMNGWEFLEEYGKLNKKLQRNSIIVMLTTSDNLDDVKRAKKISHVIDYITKPLTKDKLDAICQKYF